jgi:uncharacterized membrane protein
MMYCAGNQRTLSIMDASVPFLILLALFLVIAVPTLAISAFVRGLKLDDSLKQLRHTLSRFTELEARLSRIEAALSAAPPPGASAATAPTAPPMPSPAAAPPEAPPPPKQEPQRAPSPPIAPPRPVISTPEVSSFTGFSSTRAPLPAKVPAIEEGSSFEALVAGRWMNYVGILALLFGVAFFLKYAFENNWVGPRGRVGIGLLAGSALYPWSHRLLEKGYRYFSEGIAGLGAAILYLSLWAGWHYYQIFTQSAAFAMMIAVTAATTVVAIGRNSERIAVLALIGGILTPGILSTGENHEVALFTYLLALGAGMLAVARLRDWKTLPPIQFAATVAYFWGWYSEFYRDDALLKTIFFATLFFLLFAALPVVRSRREGELSHLEAGIVLVNAFIYLFALRTMLWPQHRWALTLAMLALAAAHLTAERALPQKESPGAIVARVLFAGLALTFVTLTIPVRLEGRWITMGWAVEGAILIWSGLRIRIGAVRAAGFVLLGVALARLAIFPIPAPQFLFNARFAAFAVCVACLLLSCWFARTSGTQLGESESAVFAGAAVIANIYALAALSLEVWDLFGRMPSLGIDRRLAQELALSLLWLIYALGLLAVGVWKKSAGVRWQALTLLGVVIGKVFFFDLSFLERFYRIVSFILLGLALLLISFYYQRYLAAQSSEKKS